MKNWKKAAGLYAAYRVGQASRREAPREAPQGDGLSGSGWKVVWIVFGGLGFILGLLLYRWTM